MTTNVLSTRAQIVHPRLGALKGLQEQPFIHTARNLLGPLVEVGATWWDDRRPIDDEVDRLELVLRRIDIGPPAG